MKSLKSLLKVLLIPSMLFVIGCGCCEEVVAPAPPPPPVEPEPMEMPAPVPPQPARG